MTNIQKFQDFSFLKTIAIEIGPDCNLRHKHTMCPAYHINREESSALSNEQICAIMDDAVNLGFDGHFAFHLYNEPLLYIYRINELKKKRSHYRFLLWSNGTLARSVVQQGYSMKIFDKIVFTCYDESYRSMLEELIVGNENAAIFSPEMDDRLHIYDSITENLFSCKKVYYELPIDYRGIVYVCSYDWDKRYVLGDLTRQSLADILQSEAYQNLLQANTTRLLNGKVPDLCTTCFRPYRGEI